MWAYHKGLHDYCLMYNKEDEDSWDFENMLNENYITPEIVTVFLEDTRAWICAYHDKDNDFIKDGVGIEEKEIITTINTHIHKR